MQKHARPDGMNNADRKLSGKLRANIEVEMATRTLNVRLLRKGGAMESAFGVSFVPGSARALRAFDWKGAEGARAYIGQIYSNPPTWQKFIAEGVIGALNEDITTGGAGAVIFVPVGERVLAICFGQVRLALDDDAFERGFGLKVTLNAVPRSNLRTLDLATPDAVTFQKRVQASKDSDLSEFGVDMLRDLARVAGGTPRDLSFSKFVAGKDSLSITCEVDANTIYAKCAEILDFYKKKTYKSEFPWVDNLRVVEERDLVLRLDAKLEGGLKALRKGRPEELHMSPPEVVDYTEGGELHYNGFGSHGKTFHSLSIEDYVSELNRCGFDKTIADIKEGHRVRAKRAGQDEFTEKWKVYDCFVYEANIASGVHNGTYVLFSGRWYKVEAKFKDRVESFFESIPKVEIVGKTSCVNERELIDDIDANRPDLLKLDQAKINPDGVRYANLEPCDFFSDKKQFIHLKDGHSSGPISHLWAQGVVSAEAFVSDPEFRSKLRSEVSNRKRVFAGYLPKKTESLNRGDFTVVYGIMRKPYVDGSLGLPFFSKVSLQAAVERIRQFGLPVAIELIEKPSSDEDEPEAEC